MRQECILIRSSMTMRRRLMRCLFMDIYALNGVGIQAIGIFGRGRPIRLLLLLIMVGDLVVAKHLDDSILGISSDCFVFEMRSEEFKKRGGPPSSYNPGYSWLWTVDHRGGRDSTPKYNGMESPSRGS